MPKLKQTEIETFRDFIDFLDVLASHSREPFWFRGTSKIRYKLHPTLYRHKNANSINEILDLERKLITRFIERSKPYLASPPDSDWEYLFLMQHFGVPTRLLDWTENPFIALFFALSGASHHQKPFQSGASVWVLSPGKWNQKAFSHVSSYGEEILSITDDQLKSYTPNSSKGTIPLEYPAAIWGVHNSPRIVAQRGVFTIFGSAIEPMEITYKKQSFPKDSLQKIIIRKDACKDIFNRVLDLGYTDSVVFPDLEGLGRDLKRQFDF